MSLTPEEQAVHDLAKEVFGGGVTVQSGGGPVGNQILQMLGGAKSSSMSVHLGPQAVQTPVQTNPSTTATTGGTQMGLGTSKIEYFGATADLAIDPPLPDRVLNSLKGSARYFELKQSKSEDVKLVNGELEIVTTNVTSISLAHEATSQHGFQDMVKEIANVANQADQNNCTVQGTIIVHADVEDKNGTEETRYYRILVNGKSVKTERAVLAWPDGSKTPVPNGEGKIEPYDVS